MAEERVFGAQRQKVINQGQTGRGNPQSDNIMNVQAVHGRAVHSRDVIRIGQKGIAENQIHSCPNEGSRGVPQRDIEALLLPPEDRAQHLNRNQRQDHETQDVQRPFEFRRLKPHVVAHQQG